MQTWELLLGLLVAISVVTVPLQLALPHMFDNRFGLMYGYAVDVLFLIVCATPPIKGRTDSLSPSMLALSSSFWISLHHILYLFVLDFPPSHPIQIDPPRMLAHRAHW